MPNSNGGAEQDFVKTPDCNIFLSFSSSYLQVETNEILFTQQNLVASAETTSFWLDNRTLLNLMVALRPESLEQFN